MSSAAPKTLNPEPTDADWILFQALGPESMSDTDALARLADTLRSALLLMTKDQREELLRQDIVKKALSWEPEADS